MRNFRLITNAFKDKDLHLSRRIVSYIEDKGGRAGISVSNIEGVVAEDFPLRTFRMIRSALLCLVEMEH